MTIKVEGTLNSESLPVLEGVYCSHATSEKQISVDLGSTISVDRHGREFLKGIRNTVRFVNMPAYLQLLIAKR